MNLLVLVLAVGPEVEFKYWWCSLVYTRPEGLGQPSFDSWISPKCSYFLTL